VLAWDGQKLKLLLAIFPHAQVDHLHNLPHQLVYPFLAVEAEDLPCFQKHKDNASFRLDKCRIFQQIEVGFISETSGLVGIALRTKASFLKDNSNSHLIRNVIALVLSATPLNRRQSLFHLLVKIARIR